MAAAIGIYVTETAVRGAIVQQRGAGCELVKAVEAPCASAADLSAVMKQIRRQLGINQPIVLGIPTTWTIFASIRPLIVTPARATLAVQFELQQQLPYDLAQVWWDYHWLGRNGHGPAARPAVVAAVKRAALADRIEACRRAGVAVQAVGVSAVAVANAWLSRRASQGVSMVLYVDGSVIELIAAGAGVLHAVTVPPAGGDPAAWVESLASAWDHLREQLGAPASGGARPTLWTLGDASSIGLAPAIEQRLGVTVKRADAESLVGRGSGVPAERALVSAGLALQRLGGAAVPLDLLGEVRRSQSAAMLRRGAWAMSAVAALTSVAIGGQAMLVALQRKEQTLTAAAAQERTYQSLRPEIRSLIQQQAQRERRLAQVRQLAERRALVPEAMQRIIESLPEEIWLTVLDVAKDDRQLTALLEGYARSFEGVTRVMEQLKTSVGWQKVKPLATTVQSDADGKELIVFGVQSQQPLPSASGAEDAAADGSGSGGTRDAAAGPPAKRAP